MHFVDYNMFIAVYPESCVQDHLAAASASNLGTDVHAVPAAAAVSSDPSWQQSPFDAAKTRSQFMGKASIKFSS
jgi:hypothetical protein